MNETNLVAWSTGTGIASGGWGMQSGRGYVRAGLRRHWLTQGRRGRRRWRLTPRRRGPWWRRGRRWAGNGRLAAEDVVLVTGDGDVTWLVIFVRFRIDDQKLRFVGAQFNALHHLIVFKINFIQFSSHRIRIVCSFISFHISSYFCYFIISSWNLVCYIADNIHSWGSFKIWINCSLWIDWIDRFNSL